MQLGDLRVWYQGKGLHGEVSFFQETMATITYGTIFELPTKPVGATLTPGSGRAETTGTQCVGRDLAHAGSRRTDERLFVNGLLTAWLYATNLRKGRKMSGSKNLNEFDTLKRHTPCCRELPIKSCNSDTQLTRTNWQWPNPWPKPHLHWWQQSTSMKAKKLNDFQCWKMFLYS